MSRFFPLRLGLFVVLVVTSLPGFGGGPLTQCERWVAPAGDDAGNGSADQPWATPQHAADTVPDGCTVWFAPGIYRGGIDIGRRYREPVTFASAEPYRAVFESSSTVVDVDGGHHVTIEGFELRHAGPGSTGPVVSIDEGNGQWAQRIVVRNNVIHDSYDDDLIKINRGVQHATVTGNLLYNQGPSEQHIDLNGVVDIVIEDNVFFNDFEASGRDGHGDAKHFVMVKDPNVDADGVLGSHRIRVRRNVFFNWQGGNEIFAKVGNDGKPIHEAVDVWFENNLFLGNSPVSSVATFGVAGAKNVWFLNNTIVGDQPSRSYALRIEIKGENPLNENIRLSNNMWVDPTGTMSDNDRFSNGDPDDTEHLVLDTNLYWNGDASIPDGAVLSPLSDDPNALVADPGLPTDQSGIVTPIWLGTRFADGNETVRQVFLDLVFSYGVIPPDSPAAGAADPCFAPADDIVGRRRIAPDIGAYQAVQPNDGATASPSIECEVTANNAW